MARVVVIGATALVAMCFAVACARKTPQEKLEDARRVLQKRDTWGAIVLAHEVLRDMGENTTGPLALEARRILVSSYSLDRNWKECRRVLDEIIKQCGLTGVEGQQAAESRIETFEFAGQTTAAIEQTRAFLEAASTGTAFWSSLTLRWGDYLRQTNQATTAQKVLARVLTNKQVGDDERFHALSLLDVCYSTTQSVPAGIEFFERYTADEPSTNVVPEVYRVMGHLASLIKDEDRKARFYAKCFEAFESLYKSAAGSEEKIQVLFRYAYARNAKGELDEAVKLLEKGLQEFRTSPSRIHLYFAVADLYIRNEKYDKGVDFLRRIPAEFPNHPQRVLAAFRIAECHLLQKKYDECITDLREIMALYPENAARANQAIRYVEAWRRKEAETSATLALSRLTSPTLTATTATAPSTLATSIVPTPASAAKAAVGLTTDPVKVAK